ncbi:hypothetical protein DFJ43DRAFT_1042700 [Lentinula guzmanii]|uniref:Uncharacterized protein n=1 Tax=Lentinula guzmanii TaxID=2804957 RepID=A0AA38JC43_9AGAR|nr:hypothetical protein DFJ43DRAFT_1042700 [Lentinula guzmanii]
MALNTTELVELGNTLLFNTSHVIGIIPEMILYGIYSTLFTVSTYIMIGQGLDVPSREFLLGLTTFMYTVTTMYMAASIANMIQLIQSLFFGFSTRNVINIQIFNALFLVNYGLTDGVVVWRAWVLCRYDHRTALLTSVFFLCCALLSEMSTIAVRVTLSCLPPSDENAFLSLSRVINITQVLNLGLSLLTNLTATGTISFKACEGQQISPAITPNNLLPKKVTILIATLIPLPKGTLGDLYTPVNLQLAGMYPLIVLIMVNKNRTLDKVVSVFSDNHETHSIGNFTTAIDTTEQSQ